MIGFTITYKSNSKSNSPKLLYALFGRIVKINYRGRKRSYYVPGMLDKTRFQKLSKARIFLEKIDDIDVNKLNELGELIIEPCEKDDSSIKLCTGKEYWSSICKDLELEVSGKGFE